MNTKQLECYIALAETLNFSKAAERCYISQSSFSRQIAALEEELGCTLIARSKVNPKLTPAGAKIYEHAKQMMDHSAEMKNIAILSKSANAGKIRVGIMERGMTRSCIELIGDYQAKCPTVNFDFRISRERELIKALEHRRVDFGILPFFPEMYQDEMDYLILETTRNCVFVPEDHPFAKRERVSIRELEGQPFVVMSGESMSTGHQFYMNLCRRHGLEPQITAQGDSISSIEYYIRCHKGIFLSVEAMFEYKIEGIVAVPVEELGDQLIYLIWNRSEDRREMKRFLEFAGDKLFRHDMR